MSIAREAKGDEEVREEGGEMGVEGEVRHKGKEEEVRGKREERLEGEIREVRENDNQEGDLEENVDAREANAECAELEEAVNQEYLQLNNTEDTRCQEEED
ncbi:hypothetical protein L6452_25911 [Arctium lappa]|uniref:Uncharacterized protein n=1 Tax=Arctium lappa TaxID=4217 RepID=A0ACB9AC42_ARCLA|nr:hypothetical protein L6452_25911 [Arctium lappa]